MHFLILDNGEFKTMETSISLRAAARISDELTSEELNLIQQEIKERLIQAVREWLEKNDAAS